MDCEFIHDVETWGSGGEMMDVVVLKDGRILVIAADRIALYENRAAFDSGGSSTVIGTASVPDESHAVEYLRRGRTNGRS